MMRTGWNHAIQIQQNVGRTFFFEHFSVAISKLQPGGVLHRRTNLACVCEQNTHRVEHVKNRAGPLYRLSCCLLYMLLPCLFDCFNAYPDNSSPLLFTKTATVFQPGEKLRRPMHCSLIMSSICLLSWKLAIFICMPYLHRIYTITWRFVHASINTGTVQKRLLEYLLISWNIWFSPPTKRLQGFKRIISVIARRLKKDLVSMLKKLSTARQVVLLIFVFLVFIIWLIYTCIHFFTFISHLYAPMKLRFTRNALLEFQAFFFLKFHMGTAVCSLVQQWERLCNMPAFILLHSIFILHSILCGLWQEYCCMHFECVHVQVMFVQMC